MTAVEEIVRREGPVTVERFMALALAHPEHGYYASGDPLGARGDFTTAPEISQLFGELMGLWCVAAWERMGGPRPIVLAELGPGRGTLMADALRAARVRPAFLEAARLVLVESNATLRARQAQALAGHAPAWHERFEDVPQGPILLLANEFFDALPVRQFVRAAAGWRERLVAWDARAARLVFALAETATDGVPDAPDAPVHAPAHAPEGAIVETSPARESLARCLARRVVAHGGAALVVDYGYDPAPGEARCWEGSLQALARHRFADPLATPGEHDLSAHVDFAALAAAARADGARVHGPIGQGAFLGALGIGTRGERLAARASGRETAALAAALHRLAAPSEMGVLFKALAIAHPALGALDGFAPLPRTGRPL